MVFRAETALTLTSAAEIASLAEDGVDVTHLRAVKKDLNRAIVAILIGNNTVNILLSTLSALVANALFRVWVSQSWWGCSPLPSSFSGR
jgi:Mg2+/Co2+ transporter CorB